MTSDSVKCKHKYPFQNIQVFQLIIRQRIIFQPFLQRLYCIFTINKRISSPHSNKWFDWRLTKENPQIDSQHDLHPKSGLFPSTLSNLGKSVVGSGAFSRFYASFTWWMDWHRTWYIFPLSQAIYSYTRFGGRTLPIPAIR